MFSTYDSWKLATPPEYDDAYFGEPPPEDDGPYEEEEIESMEPVRDKYAPTGGLNLQLCMAAFGMSEAELDKVFGEPSPTPDGG